MMKRRNLLIAMALVVGVFTVGAAEHPSGRTWPDKADGFASVNALGQNGTTGGAGGKTITVTTREELEEYAAKKEPCVIRIKGAITIPPKGREIRVASDKTITGNAPEAEEQAVKAVREVADLAEAAELRVALYPHTGFHVARLSDAVRLAEKADRANVGVTFNLCHWLKEGRPEKMLTEIRAAAPRLFVVTINGADRLGTSWKQLIQPLDQGDFDVGGFLAALRNAGFRGPVGFQGYGIGGDARQNLRRTMAAWKTLGQPAVRRLPLKEYVDKMKGGWIGQMTGVGWAGPTEFKSNGRIMASDMVPKWQPGMINQFGQDDIYIPQQKPEPSELMRSSDPGPVAGSKFTDEEKARITEK